LPRKTEENTRKAGVVVTLFVGFLMATVTILVSNLSDTNKAIGALALIIMGYIAYNELTKHFSKSRSK
jgi:positive regulator of sigma E activity